MLGWDASLCIPTLPRCSKSGNVTAGATGASASADAGRLRGLGQGMFEVDGLLGAFATRETIGGSGSMGGRHSNSSINTVPVDQRSNSLGG